MPETAWDDDGNMLELTGHEAPLWNATFSTDGEFVATSAMDLSGKIWDAETGAFLAGVQDLSMYGANWVEFSPDGKRLLVSMKGGGLQLWELTFGAD